MRAVFTTGAPALDPLVIYMALVDMMNKTSLCQRSEYKMPQTLDTREKRCCAYLWRITRYASTLALDEDGIVRRDADFSRSPRCVLYATAQRKRFVRFPVLKGSATLGCAEQSLDIHRRHSQQRRDDTKSSAVR